MQITVTLAGIDTALKRLQLLDAGARALDDTTVVAGSPEAYAPGIETGRTRSGRVARRAGGAFMLTRAVQQVAPTVVPALVAALPQGADATRRALLGRGVAIAEAARPGTPVRTGNLRASFVAATGRGR